MKECSDATANAKESNDTSVNEIVIEINDSSSSLSLIHISEPTRPY